MFVRVFLCSGLVCKYIRKAIKTLVENTTHTVLYNHTKTPYGSIADGVLFKLFLKKKKEKEGRRKSTNPTIIVSGLS